MQPREEPPESDQPKLSRSRGVDQVQLAKLEQQLMEKLQQQSEGKKLEEQADAEMAEISNAGASLSLEQILLMIAAAIMIISLPFIHYLLAIVLALFTILLALVAGLTSPKRPLGPRISLVMSLVGLLLLNIRLLLPMPPRARAVLSCFIKCSRFLFLFATFFSARTYRKRFWRKSNCDY